MFKKWLIFTQRQKSIGAFDDERKVTLTVVIGAEMFFKLVSVPSVRMFKSGSPAFFYPTSNFLHFSASSSNKYPQNFGKLTTTEKNTKSTFPDR